MAAWQLFITTLHTAVSPLSQTDHQYQLSGVQLVVSGAAFRNTQPEQTELVCVTSYNMYYLC